MISDDLKARCLRLVSSFEGGWEALAGNFDGAGLSWGPLQWNLGQGTLQRLLADLARSAPDVVRQTCQEAFLQACLQGTAADFLRENALVGLGVRPEWRASLSALARTDAAKAAFIRAAASYFDGAGRICRAYGLASERGYAFAFDRAVQQGTALRPSVTAAWTAAAGQGPQEEWQRLKVLAQAYAGSANPRWQRDVLARALSVALGGTAQSGRLVHGHSFDLARDFQIRYPQPYDLIGPAPGPLPAAVNG